MGGHFPLSDKRERDRTRERVCFIEGWGVELATVAEYQVALLCYADTLAPSHKSRNRG